MPSIPAPAPVLAEVVRSGFVEGRHRGSLVLLDADGAVELALGDVSAPVFPRSSNKPMRANDWRWPPRATPGSPSTATSSRRCWTSTG
jgi:hypothetical protein